MRTLILAALVSGLALPAVAQQAPEEVQPTGRSWRDAWSFSLGAGTDNRSKAASKSHGDAYVFGLAEWESADGLFYAGPEIETIDSNGSDLEVQAFAGVRPQFAGFDLDLKAAFKQRIDADPGVDDDAWEFTGAVSRSIGPAKARLQVQYSPDGTGAAEAWTWVEGRLGWAFTDALEGTVAVGRREQDNAIDYTGWNAGLTYALGRNLDVDVRYYDTDAGVPGDEYSDAVVAVVRTYF